MQRSLPLAVLFVLLVVTGSAQADEDHLTANLRGFEEVPAVSSFAGGTFNATLSEDRQQIDWELTYSGLSSNVTQAHIHFGQRSVNGGVMIWLCSNLASPPTPAGTQSCPDSGTIHGTITAANVVGPAGQGVSPGEFFEAQRAILRGVSYANVHTANFLGGEIRGQIQRSADD